MHKHLSCTLSRLSSSEPVAIVRVSGCLPGLHPIHLYWFRTWMTDVPFVAVRGDASTSLPLQALLTHADEVIERHLFAAAHLHLADIDISAAPAFGRFWTKADIAGFSYAIVCPLMTQSGHFTWLHRLIPAHPFPLQDAWPHRTATATRARRRGDRIKAEYLLLAQSGHASCVAECPLSGVSRTNIKSTCGPMVF